VSAGENAQKMQRDVSFGPFRFEPPSGRLWSGCQELRLTPKAAAVLTELVARPGEPVSKEALFASVWRNRAVSDDALASCIQELRKALSDDPKQPRFIETRHRRGYRFVAAVLPEGAPAPGTATQGTGKPALAVLPFHNLSGEASQEYIADGISEDIITALSKHRSFLVISRGSTFAFKGRDVDLREVGKHLNADYVVEGSVARAGPVVRVTARLIETEGARCVWGEQYDRSFEELLDLQGEIVARIAARIEPEVGSIERTRAEKRSPHALRAWDFFHLGMAHVYKPTRRDNLEARRLYRRAIELDPTLAQAHAWLSYATVLGMIYFDAPPEEGALSEAVSIARQAVELDERDAMTHFACGRALLASKAYREAIEELESARALNPNLAVVHCGLGDSLAYEGRFAEAIPFFENAIDLSPYDPQRWAFYSYRALAHVLAGEFEQALEWTQAAARVPHCHYWPFAHRVAALGHLGWHREMPDALAQLMQRKPEFSCSFAQERLFYIKNPEHLSRYLDGLRKAGVHA
jgi:TolB-like protein/Tfp pilus assembly protein PilF